MAIRKLCINKECMKLEAKCQCEDPKWRYQIDVVDLSGKRIRQLYVKKKEADNEEAKLRALKAEHRSVLEIKKEFHTTFDELADKYEDEIRHQISYDRYKRHVLGILREEFGGKRLSEVTYYDLEAFRTKRRETPTRSKGRRTASTLNKEVGVITHMFTKALEWDLIEKSPFEGKRTLRLKENNRLLGLKWSDIAGGFIYLTKTKTDEPRQIPIDEGLDKILKRIRKRQWKDGLKSEHVLLYHGNAFKNTRKGFVGALKRSNITDFRIHDLRHTFASHYMMRGGSLGTLQKILGHKDIKMTMRYAHLSSEFARQEIERMSDLTNVKSMSNSGSGKKSKLASI
jgi:integrase